MNHWTPSPGLLKDRIILVTGAGDGIGKACATAFAAYGATVVLLGRTIRKLENVYDEIEQAGSPQPAIYPMNLEGATAKDYEELAQTLAREFGRLDGLLHNAAMLGTLTPIAHYDPELWLQSIQVNLNAPFLLTQACIGLLTASQDASLLFTSDQVGRRGKAYWGAYGVAKAAIEGLMQTLADELENNTSVRVNSIDPGVVRTAMRTLAYPGEDPNNNVLPQAIVAPYLYLMSAEAKNKTGRQFMAQGQTQLPWMD